ncbi:MAG TPA: DinB family protein [Thermomicrobiales bacterium]|nr:DinB family protein [Thermomicrobiales bacterium]
MPGKPLTIDEILTRLREAPPRIAALTDGLEPAQLRLQPAPNEWSANDVLAHLRACADVWGGCIATIIAEDRPTIRAIDPRTWVERTDYRQLEFQPSLDAFARQRDKLLASLESLTDDGWPRAATMTGAGRPIERTVQSFAQRLARHERPHIRQIGKIAEAMRE